MTGAFTALAAAAIIGGDGIVNERVIQWMAAYKALDISYEELLGRFEKHLGKERFEEILYEAEEVENEDGEKEIIVHPEERAKLSPFARFFDEANPNWDNRNPFYNKNFIMLQLAYLNQLLQARLDEDPEHGVVLQNEAFEALGYEPVAEGYKMGWGKDDVISFGLEDMTNPMIRLFMLGEEPSVLLTFNSHWVGDRMSRDIDFLPKLPRLGIGPDRID